MTELGRIGPTTGQGATAARPRAAPADARFTVPTAAQPSGGQSAGAPSETAATSALSGLLALQEADAGASHDREARRRGRDILAALAELQRALLGGGDSPDALTRLAELVSDLPRASDPRLGAVLAAIGLRARVELARRRLDPALTRPGRSMRT